MQCILCKIYFWKVFHKYYNFICAPICTKVLFLQKVGVTPTPVVLPSAGKTPVRGYRGLRFEPSWVTRRSYSGLIGSDILPIRDHRHRREDWCGSGPGLDLFRLVVFPFIQERCDCVGYGVRGSPAIWFWREPGHIKIFLGRNRQAGDIWCMRPLQ
jgi:hypothetical protein